MLIRGGWALIVVSLLALVFQLPFPVLASASKPSQQIQVCDPLADYFLGMEDYPEAIRRHLIVIKEHPANALAHYHLGFAYGVTGRHRLELAEYEKAISLGFDDWQIFLNLGLLYLENGQLTDATEVLRLATLLGPEHPEAHFNLGVAYERRGMYEPAEQQLLLSLQLDPDQVEAHNTLGAIYAQEGKYMRASEEWTELEHTYPDYAPARINLDILHRAELAQPGENAAHDSGLTGTR